MVLDWTAMINWSISFMDVIPTAGERANVVTAVHWNCYGTEIIDGVTYGGAQSGTTGFELNLEGVFTPFEELTPQQVFNWFLTLEKKAEIEAKVLEQIQAKASPLMARVAPPWSAVPEAPAPEAPELDLPTTEPVYVVGA